MNRAELLSSLYRIYRGIDQHEDYYKLEQFILRKTEDEHKIPALLKPTPEPAPAAQGDALDAARWRRLVRASEMAFPVASIADDPENDVRMVYGRKRMEDFIDALDEIPSYYAARAAKEGGA